MGINRGEVSEVKETPGWKRIRVQVGSGVIDTVGPKETAKACEMKEMARSKRGIGFVAAKGSRIKNYGEQKITRYTGEDEGVSLRIHCEDAKKVLGSVHKMNMGGNAVVLGGDKSYTQIKETSEKTRTNYEQGQFVV